MKRIQQLRSRSTTELKHRLENMNAEFPRARFRSKRLHPEDTHELRRLRKEKARILTILHERRLNP